MKKLLPKVYPVTCHTDHVGPDTTFIAIKGYKSDGNQYINKARSLGATTIISESPGPGVTVVQDARRELALRSAQALGSPAEKLTIIGITGTKGKTSTAFLVQHIFSQAGFKTALLGSVKNKIGDDEDSSSLTTPESDSLQMFLSQCVLKDVSHVVMEVSSHSLSLDRVYGINFSVACFTNLAPEHMDFYSGIQDYFNAKAKLFDQCKGCAIVNTDDEWGKKLKHPRLIPVTKSQFNVENNFIDGLKIEVDRDFIESPLFGEFNAYNVVMAYRVAINLGVKKEVIYKALKNFPGVPGRMQMHRLKNGARAFVDYAHNPSSMDAVLKELRRLTDHLIVVFGCGGDRDKTKRPEMGRLAEFYGDEVIITEDNPWFENPSSIIGDILSGVKGDVIVELDRGRAIHRAVSMACPGSVVAVLGKGHEDYHLVRGGKLHFDDFKEINKY